MSSNDLGGVWRTIGGRRVFIKEGQSLSDAMKNSGKFNNKENNMFDSKDNFKNYIKDELKDFNDNIEKIYLSKENKHGQWGVYVKGKETFSPTTKRFYNYETYIPFEESYRQNKELFTSTIEYVKAEIEEFYKK